MSGSSGINWGSVYNTPIGQILQDLNPSNFVQLTDQATQSQSTSYQNQISQDKTELSAWGTLQADAQSVASNLSSLANGSIFSQLTSTSSNSNVASAVDQSAQQGSYTISVGALAQSEIDSGSAANMAVTDPNATLTLPGSTTPIQGSFTIQVGTQSAVTITLPSGGESLNSLVSQINNQSGIGVTASAVQNGNGQWVMDIQANQTGQPITYTDTGVSGQTNGPLYYLGVVSSDTTAAGSTQLSGANVMQKASSAQVSFGSTFNSSTAISSTSNTFSNLIPGMTITAQSTGTTTISVQPDISAMTNAVTHFVSSWNQWVKDTQNLAQAGTIVQTGAGASATYNYVANSNQVLTSGLPTSVLNQAQQILGSTRTGVGTYQSLADLGITFSSNGTLSVSSGALSQAISSNPSAVKAIFQSLQSVMVTGGSNSDGVITGFSLGPSSTIGQAEATLNKQVAQDQNSVAMLNQQLSNQEQQAIIQYGQWVNSVAKESQQYSLLSALFNTGTSSTTGG